MFQEDRAMFKLQIRPGVERVEFEGDNYAGPPYPVDMHSAILLSWN